MSNWRTHILQEFIPDTWPLTLVADPDHLVQDEQILVELERRGFAVRPFTPQKDDPIRLLYEFEREFRSRRAHGESKNLIIVVCGNSDARKSLPYPITMNTPKTICFQLSDFFPRLDPVALRALRGPELDKLYVALEQHPTGPLGDQHTRDYVLRHVFGFAPELITTEAALLHFLLDWHFRRVSINPPLRGRLLEHLQPQSFAVGWPLGRLLDSREEFLSFLQERWEEYVHKREGLLNSREEFLTFLQEGEEAYVQNGEGSLPFADKRVRAYMDTYFLDGLLRPVVVEMPETDSSSDPPVGVVYDASLARAKRQKHLISACAMALPDTSASYQDWRSFADRWAQLLQIYADGGAAAADLLPSMQELRKSVDDRFLAWLKSRYNTLHNLPATTPVMVHHVPRTMALERERHGLKKVALVVVDGLSLVQWLTITSVLQCQQPDLILPQENIFAWIPSISEVSRQSIFSGEWPNEFRESIDRTDKEAECWRRFWVSYNVPSSAVLFCKSLGLGKVEELRAELGHPQIQVAGLVVDTVDDLAHKAILGTKAYTGDVRQWAETGYLSDLLQMLTEYGFSIYLTSDHGQVEAVGIGAPKQEAKLASGRVKRALVFRTPELRDQMVPQFPDAVTWRPAGLPEDYLPVMANGRTAFVKEHQKIIGHGSITLEEVLVPFVRVKRRTS